MFTIVSAIAELERNIIVERVKSGLRRAREKGKTLGRPKLDLSLKSILEMRERGLSFEEIGNKMGVCAATIYNVTKKGREEARIFEDDNDH